MAYTRITTALFDWAPYVNASPVARCLWLGLYASPEAKRMLPGLFHGGLAIMAEASRLSAQQTDDALRELEDRGAVVADRQRRLTLFCGLPDRGERPANGSVLKMFWRRWLDMPEGRLRRSWVDLLAWLCHPLTQDHQTVWSLTFDSLPLETENAGGNSPHPDTKKQTSLFPHISDTVCGTVSDTVSDTPQVEVRGNSREGGVGGEVTPCPTPCADAVEVASYLASAIRSHTPSFEAGRRKLAGWATWIDKSLRRGRTPEQLRTIIDHCHRDEADTFWRANLLSGRKLHEKFDQLSIRARQGTKSAADSVKVGRVEPLDPDSYGAPGAVKDF